ncbi:MAG: DEAD/DEAH box helicase family protein [Rubricoccaceae bacterium]
MDKKALSERDICTKYITPALVGAGWDVQKQIREEVSFTEGRIVQRGKLHTRGKQKRADYLLYYKKDLPLAVVEAKDNKHTVGHGMQQALGYAETLDVPFAYSSNGDGFIEHDRTGQGAQVERQLANDEFPSPAELWQRYRRWKGLTDEAERVVLQDYYAEAGGKEPRYYQRVAINRTVEGIAQGAKRLLLVMATGTGKTYTAFQVIWRLWKAGRAKRVLFLADRNILVDQAIQNDFRPFGGAMVKVQREVDKSFEVYLALYQAVVGSDGREDLFRQFSPDFFDLIVVDECHRGSASADSAWREVLKYFEPAAQLGLTATPKETTDVSTSHYFGDPVYTYSLKEGIDDGFLAPYRVVRVGLDRDLEGWRPEDGQLDTYGEEIEDRIYNQKDFDRQLVIDERTETVAGKITEYLKGTDRYAKTIVFCVDIDHAERMRRALVNANPDLAAEDRRYVVRITGDSEEGKRELDHFIDPESRFPVIATTSKMLTTGVDAQTCKLIVLDAPIGSMTEFKQIIGRGTRLREDYGKVSFTIMDFRKNTDKFADPAFDGEPVQVYVAGEADSPVPPEAEPDASSTDDDATSSTKPDVSWDPDAPTEGRTKYYVKGVEVKVVNERVQYYGAGGKLITESLHDYTRKTVHEQYASLDDFLTRWREADRKGAIIEELAEQGLFLDELAKDVGKAIGNEAAPFDPFDLVCYVAFDRPPLTRSERARKVRESSVFDQYEAPARAVLDALLDKYADEGIDDIEEISVLRVTPLNTFGSPLEIVRRFGGPDRYHEAVRQLERELYRAA